MTWNVRQIYHDTTESTYFALHEVHYNKYNEIIAWSEEPIQIISEDLEGLQWYLQACANALEEPILNLSELQSNLRKEES